ncbi:MAG: TolC family protein [Verrucomicrobiales bacterium]|nr:TolC family protein [Verrucomicrobiales bacterium]
MRWSLVLLFVGVSGCGTLVDRLSPGKVELDAGGGFLRDGGDGGVAMPDGGEWWKVFGDPELDRLVGQLDVKNTDLGIAKARVEASHEALGVTRSGVFPRLVGEGASGMRRDSVNNLLFPIDQAEYERYQIGATASWEVDLWGRVRGMVARDRFKAEAEDARLVGTVLSLRANLARQYFAFRAAEREAVILRQAVAVRAEGLRLQESRLELGSGTALDVARARGELESARAAGEAAARSRGKLLHAIAVLVGEMPGNFAGVGKDVGDWSVGVPTVPAGVPASLLERRPDVWAAEREVEAAAKQVGVRSADFFPKVTLTGIGGVASLKAGSFLDQDSSFFDVGPEVDLPLFQAGARVAAVAGEKARLEEAKEVYRGTFLIAVREVDDALLEVKTLGRELAAQQRAAAATTEAVELAELRYEKGLVSYLEVVDAQRTRLQAVRVANALAGEQRAAVVGLVQALGGSW